MSAAYRQIQEVSSDPFASSRRLFDDLVSTASSARALTAGHAEVEQAIVSSGRELLRQLFQDHLHLRTAQERRVEVVNREGVRMSERRVLPRKLRSLLGPVTWWRFLYQHADNDGLAPGDANLRLCDDGYSMGVRREVARKCAQDAYACAMEDLECSTSVAVALRQAEELTLRASVDVHAFYKQQPPRPVPAQALLVLSFDAAGIIMRLSSLRPATRKKAEQQPRDASFPPKTKSGSKDHRKRMAQVGAVFNVAPYHRTVEDILGELRSLAPDDKETPRPPRPRPVNKRIFASIEKDMEKVVQEGFRDALTRDPERKCRWIVLVDGNRDQIRCIKRIARRLRVTITIIADLIHVIEYLWPAAYCFHDAGSEDAKQWVVQRVRALLEGADPIQVAAGMRRSATRQNLTKRSAVDKCANYMRQLASYMHYGDALRDGLPIATGVIEGACRHLVRRRLDIGGTWSTKGAEAVLLLRAVVLSGDFDEYWAFHERQVYRRTHESSYLGDVPRTSASLRLVK
jgi:hypothetical protein